MWKIIIYLPNGRALIFQEGKKNVQSIEVDTDGTAQATIDYKDGKRKIFAGMPLVFERL